MELATGGVEGVLLLFGDSGPDERAAFAIDEPHKQGLCGPAPEGLLFVHAADDLAAEHA